MMIIQGMFGKEKQLVVKDYMNLDDATSQVFWPIYNSYEQERQALIRERLQNMKTYIEKYGEINGESAHKIIKSNLKNEVDLIKLEEKYLDKMNKAVGGIQAAKFFQLENYLRTLVFSKIQEQIPAIDEIAD